MRLSFVGTFGPANQAPKRSSKPRQRSDVAVFVGSTGSEVVQGKGGGSPDLQKPA